MEQLVESRERIAEGSANAKMESSKQAGDLLRDCRMSKDEVEEHAALSPEEKAMTSCLQQNEADQALSIFAQARKVNSRMINMAFTAWLSVGVRIDTAIVDMLKACGAHGVEPTAAMHYNVLGALSKRSPPEAVLAWLARMRDTKVKLDRIACNVQLKALCDMGELSDAVQLLSSMMRDTERSGGPPLPDSISFNTIVGALAEAAQASKAEKLIMTMLDSGFHPDTRSFTGVIVAYARASKVEQAVKWLERMMERGIQPDVPCFNAVLLAYANAADCEGAFRAMGMVESKARDECPYARPDVISFNTLISACAKAGQPKRAEEAFFQMEKRGLLPNHVTFSTVICAHARAGNPREAQSWLDAMLTRGCTPDAVSYNSVLAAHAQVGDASAALEVFHAMGRAGISASPSTHSIMINALVKANQADGAESLLREVVGSGVRLEASSFNSLLSLYAKCGDSERALAILALMEHAHVRPSLVTFNALAACYASYGNLSAAEDALNQAKEAGFVLDRYSFGALLQAASKAGSDVKGAGVRFVRMMLKSGIEVNDFLHKAAVRVVGERTYAELRAEYGHTPTYRSRSDWGAGPARPSTRAWGGAQAELVSKVEGGSARAPLGGKTADAGASEVTDGWTTVQNRSKRQGKKPFHAAKGAATSPAGGRRFATAKSPIRKATTSPGRQTGEPGSSRPLAKVPSASDVRLVGGAMTRSKSEKERLLHLAQDVAAAAAPVALDPSLPSSDRSLPTLKRSAASELALCMSSDLAL